MGNSTPPSTWEGVELTTMFTHIHEQKPATVLRGQHLWNHDINRQFEKNKPTWGDTTGHENSKRLLLSARAKLKFHKVSRATC